MSELPAILQSQNREKLLDLARKAGANHLNPIQTAQLLKISEKDTQILFYNDPEIASIYAEAHLKEQLSYLSAIKEIATDPDPENKQRYSAAKYLYELFSGNKSSQTTFNIAIMNRPESITTANSLKLIETLDAETVEKIAND